jgi:hypothetical protein
MNTGTRRHRAAATGRNPSLLLFLLLLTAVAASAAGPEGKYKAPRTEDGQSDLQGVWNFSSDVPLERPSAFADKKFFTREELAQQKTTKEKALATVAKFAPVEAVGLAWLDYAAKIENLRTSLISYPENGRLPTLVEGVRRVPGVEDFVAALSDAKGSFPPALLASFGSGKKDGPEDFGASDRCLGGAGPPFTPGFDNNYMQVIQAKDHVVLLTEPRHHARIVPLDGRPQLGEKLRSWSGDSRGHWEGETLVIETRIFNNRTQSFAGAGTSHDKAVTERFTRVSANALEYEATIVDPKTFQHKIVLSFPMARSDSRIYEVACHEGNYSMFNMLSGARKEEQEAMKR